MDIETRIERIEKSGRRWMAVSCTLALLLGAMVLMGQAGAPARTMTLEKLVIRDSENRERITLETFPDGTAGITITDERGRDRIMIGSLSEKLPAPAGGRSHMVFLDTEDRERITIGTSNKGWATVAVYDLERRPRISIGSAPDGKAVTLHLDETGKVVASAP